MGEFKRKLARRMADKRRLGPAYPAFYAGVKTAVATQAPFAENRFFYEEEPAKRADKGQFDGACNRTACQVSIAGANWFNTSTRAYYCGRCADLIDEWNVRRGEPRILIRVDDPIDQPPFDMTGRT